MRIVTFDDNSVDQSKLANAIRTWGKMRGLTDLIIMEFDSMTHVEFSLPDIISSDVFFLDIVTNERSDAGLVLAQKLRMAHSKTNIVFTTSCPDHWSDAFDLSALHYLIKPIQIEKLYHLLDNIYLSPSVRTLKTVSFWGEEGKEFFECDKILYIEALTSNHTAIIHFTDKTDSVIRLSGTSFSNLAANHLPTDFVQCHKSFIINANYIEKYNSQYVTLISSDAEIPIGRRFRSKMLEKLIDRQIGGYSQ